MVNLLQTLLETIQVDVALFARVQTFPEASDSFFALIFGLAGCHVRRKIVMASFKGA